jgi:hypothetical protein
MRVVRTIICSLVVITHVSLVGAGSAFGADECAQLRRESWSQFETESWMNICHELPVVGTKDVHNVPRLGQDFLKDLGTFTFRRILRGRIIRIEDVELGDILDAVPSGPPPPLKPQRQVVLQNWFARELALKSVHSSDPIVLKDMQIENRLELEVDSPHVGLDGGSFHSIGLKTDGAFDINGTHVTDSIEVADRTSGLKHDRLFSADNRMTDVQAGGRVSVSSTVHMFRLLRTSARELQLQNATYLVVMDSDIARQLWVIRDDQTNLTINHSDIKELAYSCLCDGSQQTKTILPAYQDIGNGTHIGGVRVFSYTLRPNNDYDLVGETVAQFPRVYKSTDKQEYNRLLYDTVAEELKRTGSWKLYRRVMFFRDFDQTFGNNESSDQSGTLNKIIAASLMVSTGFGQYPEIGLLWVFLAGIGLYFAFRSGAAMTRRQLQPRSWAFFTLDSLIPLLSLDESFKYVEFNGWRQYLLYGAKVLSVIFALLIWKVFERQLST